MHAWTYAGSPCLWRRETSISSTVFIVSQEDLKTFVSLGPRAWTEARETLTAVLTDAVEKCSAEGESDLIRDACWEMVRGVCTLALALLPHRQSSTVSISGAVHQLCLHHIRRGAKIRHACPD